MKHVLDQGGFRLEAALSLPSKCQVTGVCSYTQSWFWDQYGGLVGKDTSAEPKDLSSIFYTQHEKRRNQTPKSPHKINRNLQKIINFVLSIYCSLYTGIYV